VSERVRDMAIERESQGQRETEIGVTRSPALEGFPKCGSESLSLLQVLLHRPFRFLSPFFLFSSTLSSTHWRHTRNKHYSRIVNYFIYKHCRRDIKCDNIKL